MSPGLFRILFFSVFVFSTINNCHSEDLSRWVDSERILRDLSRPCVQERGLSRQGRGSVLNYAEYLYSKGEFYRAITEYKRYLFHHPRDSGNANLANYRIGLCYEGAGKWELARNYLEEVLQAKADAELCHRAGIALARTYLSEGKYGLSRLELNEVLRKNLFVESVQEARYRKGITYLYEYNWEGAKQEFDRIDAGKYLSSIELLKPEIKRAMQLPCKSEKFSLRLSTFIPGSGQIYSGAVLKGTISFLLNSSLAYLTYRLAEDEDWAGAAIVFWSGLARFYSGNRSGAVRAAKVWNENLNAEAVNEMKPFFNLSSPK